MITLRLLGGVKKAVGEPTVYIDKPSVSVSETLRFLQSISKDPKLLQPKNLIVAINGVDSAALKGQDTMIKSGDIVTIVTVVHGGMDFSTGGSDAFVSIIGVTCVAIEPGQLIDKLRIDNTNLTIQAVNSSAVYGVDHVLGVIRIVLNTEKRGIMLANKLETELLMRLACTEQISEAIKRAGLKRNMPGCFIGLSKDGADLQHFAACVKNNFEMDDSVLKPDKEKKIKLSKMLGLNIEFEEEIFIKYLLERSAILLR